MKPTNINDAPSNATYWAPQTDDWVECYYRLENGLWYIVNAYWASDVTERPYGRPAKAWNENGFPELIRDVNELILLENFK